VEHRSRIDWTAQGLAYPRFLISLCAANFAYDVDGDALAAATEARSAEAIAPSDAYRAQALCMRASIARYAGEAVAQRDHLQNAVEIFNRLAPAQLSGYERLVPLVIAEELANVGRSVEARSFVQLYEAHAETSSMLAITGDPRREAYEKLVLGQLLYAEGDVAGSFGAYREALDTFRRVGYLRRSAMAALRLVRITPSDDFLWGYLESATATLAESSWIRSGVGLLRGHALRAKLTLVQIEYLRLLCAGKTNPEIAQIRGRSPHTVRNQIVPLFEIFGVQSRSELVAECFRSGVLQDERPAQNVLASR
jgi:DNA-binding CsgD family transcriptional regulator